MVQLETVAPATPATGRRPVFVLLAVFAVVAFAGGLVQRAAAHGAALPAPVRPLPLYLSMIVLEWGLVLYVARAGLRGARFAELVGGHWRGPADVLRDVGLALATWAAWISISIGLARLWGAGRATLVRSLLPHDPLEITLWLALSLSAGFAEELVFRGYLLRELRAMTGSAAAALAIQALMFGAAHGYQGVRAMLTITLYGLVFGLLTLRLRSLRVPMLAHAWTDIASGLWRI